MKTIIQVEFLKIEQGETYIVNVPATDTAEDLAYTIRNELHKGGIVLVNIYIDHVFSIEEE
jgi:hypothetical protein